jgi:hypothetical protein
VFYSSARSSGITGIRTVRTKRRKLTGGLAVLGTPGAAMLAKTM